MCLSAHAHTRDEIRAMCQAIWLSDRLGPSGRHHDFWEMVHKSYIVIDTEFDRFHKGEFDMGICNSCCLECLIKRWICLTGMEAAGWDVTRTLLDWDEWRLEWKPKIG